MKKHLNSVLTLFIIVAIVSVALATVNEITAPIIEQQQSAAANEALLVVMPNGGTFEKVDISSYEGLPEGINEVYTASNGGYVIQITFAGFNPGNVAMIGIDAEGKVTGTKVITNVESSGYGADRLPELDANGHFNGADINTIDGVDTVAGCTVSSKAYRSAIKDALAAATILGGGSYASPEEIFQNNLNAALGTSGAEFEKHFFMEVVEGVKAIYTEKNGAGHVVLIGDSFIGVANGAVVAAVDSETNAITPSDADSATAIGAVDTINATTFEDIDLSLYDVSKRVKSAKVTNNGIYVLEVEGSGFGKKGSSDYGASGEYIVIRIALTADGRIVDCYTVYQSESTGWGAACGTEEFYGQFAGKTQDNYEDIEIAGCTLTNKGYHGAIKNAFKAVAKFIEGGAQ